MWYLLFGLLKLQNTKQKWVWELFPQKQEFPNPLKFGHFTFIFNDQNYLSKNFKVLIHLNLVLIRNHCLLRFQTYYLKLWLKLQM